MAKPRFTNEQIAEILQQSKEGASNKELCEHYQFSVSTLRRWQEQHADGIRSELKKTESKAQIVFLVFFAIAILLGNSAFINLLCLLYPPVSQHLWQTY